MTVKIFAILSSSCYLALSFSLNAAAQAPDLRLDTDAALAELQSWEVCNETSFIVRLANAVIRNGKINPKGWDRVKPGQCLPLDAPNNSPRYIFAESSPAHQGGIREWTGKTPICVSENDFTADATKSCQLQNLESRNYLSVNPAEQRTTLIEADNFGSKSDIAGIQRLLSDIGYKITRIDGITGRRTNRYIREFKKKSNLPASASNSDLIDALAIAAQKKQSNIGFELCNNSSANIWAAMATRDNGAWQSRGWWTVTKDACIRPSTTSLKGAEAHFFALQENIIETETGKTFGPDKRLRSVATTPTQFCIGEAKFSALGREYCAEAGYAIATFRPLPTETDGAKVNLTDQDFAVPNAVGLR